MTNLLTPFQQHVPSLVQVLTISLQHIIDLLMLNCSSKIGGPHRVGPRSRRFHGLQRRQARLLRRHCRRRRCSRERQEGLQRGRVSGCHRAGKGTESQRVLKLFSIEKGNEIDNLAFKNMF